MKRRLLTYRSAAIYALVMSLLIHLFFLVIFFFGRDAVLPPEDVPRPPAEIHLYFLLCSFVSTFLLAFGLYVICFVILKKDMPPRIKMPLFIISLIVATFLLGRGLHYLQIELFDIPLHPVKGKALKGGLARDYFLAAIVAFSSYVTYLSYRKQLMDVENEALRAENANARFQALRSQVDPHFLFNTFNTLYSMIKVDPDKAQEYVQKMSSVFRYSLQNKDAVTLEHELAFTKDYCALMQIRYGDSLSFMFNIEDKYMNYMVIPHSVQSLVENAIKHNIISNRQPLRVEIYTSDDDTLTVSNPVQPKQDPEEGAGIGLANIAERYRLKWKKDIVVAHQDEFTVAIPLIEPREEQL